MKKKLPLLDWPLMENNITREDLDSLIDYLKQEEPRLTQGEQVQAFEKEWSEWLGVRYSVFVNSGSSANLLTLAALREHYGQGEVIVPTLGWISDIVSVLYQEFRPIFVDITLSNLAMDPKQVLSKITSHTRAIFLTHILGYNGLGNELLKELKRRGIPLIEDVCESHGATFENKKLGTFGLISNFSFYYAHHLSTIEGGMICTDNESIYQTLRMLRSHGMIRESTSTSLTNQYHLDFPDLNPQFIFAFPAYNVRNTELQAVLGRSGLPRLDQNIQQRKKNLDLFLDSLDSEKYFTAFERKGNSSYAFTLVLQHPDPSLRDQVESTLTQMNVEFRRGLSGGGNQLRQPYLKNKAFEWNPHEFPNVEHVHFFGYYLGNYPSLDQEKIKKLCKALNRLKPSS